MHPDTDLLQGARYAQVVKRTGVTVNKENAMIGSFSAAAEPRRILVVEDEFPSGMLTRGSYSVKSRVNDFDGGIFAGKYNRPDPRYAKC